MYSKEEIESLRLLYQVVDLDGNGSLSRGEISSFLFDLGIQLSEIQRDQFFTLIDADGNEEISFEEFLDGWDQLFDAEFLVAISKIRKIFSVYDIDEDHQISREDLAAFYMKFEKTEYPELIHSFFSRVKPSNPNHISWAEFLAYAIEKFDAFDEYHTQLGIL